MRRFIIIWLACFGLGLDPVRAAHTQVTLLLSAETARPGDTVLAGLDLKMEPGWHTYWKNPGESGIATAIKWDLPPGVTAGDIQWPLPEKLPPIEVTTYGYLDEVMLIVPLKIAADVDTNQPIAIKANLSWLECKEQCIPGKTSVFGKINLGNPTKALTAAPLIESWQKKVPASITSSTWKVHAAWEKPAEGDSRPLIIEGQLAEQPAKSLKVNAADLFPGISDSYEILPAAELLPAPGVDFRLRKMVKKFSGDWPQTISGVLVLSNGNESSNYEVSLDLSGKAGASLAAGASGETTGEAPQSLGLMLLYAFLGGLMLNIMPCVLPVIALKIFGFVSEAGGHPRRVRLLGLVYGLGVIVSFLVVAGFVIGLKSAGHRVGWGTQFGNPIFLVTLATLVLLVALNLFGVFEVIMSGKALDSANRLASRHGYPGAFFNGLLATIMGTSCSAPFMGPALGFALLQSATVIVLIFLLMGLGLASPYVVLSWNPAWLKFLPKPGAWMEKFKIAMGFPMLAALIWLFTLAGRVYGSNLLWLGFFLVLVALAAWIFGEFFQRGRKNTMAALAITVIIAAGAYAWILEGKLHWRSPVLAGESAGSLKESADGIDWQKWSPEAVTAARKAGFPVLVDFTADWCPNCQANKRLSIEIPSVRAKIKELNAVAFIADYTLGPDNITDELSRYGRASVPLVLVFPKAPEAPAIVLPAVLTPGIVLDALSQAAK